MRIVSADDETRVGSFGALAKATGESDIVEIIDGGLRVLVEFCAVYSSSDFAGGDRPGGMAEGALHSVIEFHMPVITIDWIYGMTVDDTSDFSGSTSIIVENISQSQLLLGVCPSNPLTHHRRVLSPCQTQGFREAKHPLKGSGDITRTDS